jgi:hypothetical protein
VPCERDSLKSLQRNLQEKTQKRYKETMPSITTYDYDPSEEEAFSEYIAENEYIQQEQAAEMDKGIAAAEDLPEGEGEAKAYLPQITEIIKGIGHEHNK